MFAKFKKHENCRIIFIISAIFYFTTLFCAIPDSEIQALATIKFSNTPGFNRLLHSGNSGRFFEMQSALYILFNKMGHQDILGFDLEIVFYPEFVDFKLENETISLRTTEFDVITTDFVIECKNSAAPRNGKSIAQFIKEKKTLDWARWVAHKIKRGKIHIEHDLKHKRGEKTFFTLSHFSKKTNSNLTLSCNWIIGGNSHTRVESFKKIILMLAEKKLIVFFANHADEAFTKSLVENEIDFVENVRIACH